ncbi:MAG: hypothetical protein ACSHX9_01140 [Luteolibacter sp.]
MTSFIRLPLIAVTSFFLASCGDDPELVKKRGEQEAKIAKLKGDLALVQEQLKSLPSDKSKELALSKKQTELLEAKRKKLATEVSSLEIERDRIKKEYEDYRRKYAVK